MIKKSSSLWGKRAGELKTILQLFRKNQPPIDLEHKTLLPPITKEAIVQEKQRWRKGYPANSDSIFLILPCLVWENILKRLSRHDILAFKLVNSIAAWIGVNWVTQLKIRWGVNMEKLIERAHSLVFDPLYLKELYIDSDVGISIIEQLIPSLSSLSSLKLSSGNHPPMQALNLFSPSLTSLESDIDIECEDSSELATKLSRLKRLKARDDIVSLSLRYATNLQSLETNALYIEDTERLQHLTKLTKLSLQYFSIKSAKYTLKNITDLTITYEMDFQRIDISWFENIPKLRSLKYNFYALCPRPAVFSTTLESLEVISAGEWHNLVKDQVSTLAWVQNLQSLSVCSGKKHPQVTGMIQFPYYGFPKMHTLRLKSQATVAPDWDGALLVPNLTNLHVCVGPDTSIRAFPPKLRSLSLLDFRFSRDSKRYQVLDFPPFPLSLERLACSVAIESNLFSMMPPNLEVFKIKTMAYRGHISDVEHNTSELAPPEFIFPPSIHTLHLLSLRVSPSQLPPSLRIFSTFQHFSYSELSMLPLSLVDLTVEGNDVDIDLLRFALDRAEKMRTITSKSVKAYFGHIMFDTFPQKAGRFYGREAILDHLKNRTIVF